MCKICDMIFVQEQFLIKHIEDSHNEGNTVYVNPNVKSEEADIPIEIYQCSVCNDQFKSVAGVTFHLSTVHEGNKPNTCSDCDYSHKKMNVLKNHIESVHELIQCGFSKHSSFYGYNHSQSKYWVYFPHELLTDEKLHQ